MQRTLSDVANDLRAAGPPRVGDLDVVVRGTVVDGLRMRGSPTCRGGVLLGTRVDGRTEVDAAVQVAESPAPPALNLTPEAWAAVEIVRGRDHPELEVVGWWEYRPGGLAFPTAVDEFVHQAWFSESTQVALLVGERPGDQGVWAWREGRLTRVPADRVFTLVPWSQAVGPPPEVPIPVRLGTSLFPDYDPTPPSTPAVEPTGESPPAPPPPLLTTVERTYGELATPEEEAVVPDWMTEPAEREVPTTTASRVVGVLALLSVAVLLVLGLQRLFGGDNEAATTTTAVPSTTATTVPVTAPPATSATTTTLVPQVETTLPPTTAVETTLPPDPGFREYTIKEGDTIGEIAQAVYGRERCRLAVTDATGDPFGASEVIRPGEVIHLPVSYPEENCTLDEAALEALAAG